MKIRLIFSIIVFTIFLAGCDTGVRGFISERCSLSSSSGLFCVGFTADSEGITFVLRNSIREEIIINSIIVNVPDKDGSIKTCEFKGEKIIKPEEKAIIKASCDLRKGQRIDAYINIDYIKKDSGFEKTSVGRILTVVN